MTTPEPVDEEAPVPAETRGGDRLADITAPRFVPAWDTNNADGVYSCGPDCECGTE